MTPVCDYCASEAVLIDSAEVYGKSYGLLWMCWPCDAYVSVHRNSKRNVPMGRLSNAELRYWKREAHNAFDQIWKGKKGSVQQRRQNAYKWLAYKMKLDEKSCHIGRFDVAQCRQVVELCASSFNFEE